MPWKCSVPFCRGNYDAENTVHIFSVPTDEDERTKWKSAIPRKDFLFTKSSRVCERHFKPHEIRWETRVFNDVTGETIVVKLKNPRLVPGTIPSVFPGCPAYLTKNYSTRDSPSCKRRKNEDPNLSRVLRESEMTKLDYDQRRLFKNLNELNIVLAKFPVSDYWTCVKKCKSVLFLNIQECDSPNILHVVTINEELQVKVLYKHQMLHSLGKFNFPYTVANINEVQDILDYIEHSETNPSDPLFYILDIVKCLLESLQSIPSCNQTVLNFIYNQVCLLNLKPEKYKYSPDYLIFTSLFYFISPAAYKFVRSSGNVILPHPNTIRKFSSKASVSPHLELDGENFLNYAKQKFSFLKEHEFIVSLMLDEIHIKQNFDFKGGNIVGSAHDDKSSACSAYVFMLQSLLSSHKDVVHVLPTRKIKGEILFEIVKKIICGLEKIGYFVTIVVTDNNSINRNAMSYFSKKATNSFVYEHPIQPPTSSNLNTISPLFYAIDSVHLIKCVRNNWLNQTNCEQAMYYPHFNVDSLELDSIGNVKLKTASFLSLKTLYEIESINLLKYGYTLSSKALWPTNMERQKVSLALQIFNSHIYQGLKELGPRNSIENWESTAAYINIFSSWFDIMNVKTPHKGKHSLNRMCEPLTTDESDERVAFLDRFLDWLEIWGDYAGDTGHLTRETYSALKQTTNCMLEFTKYCVEELSMKYLLPGKVQTDELEFRFGVYRRLAGTQYHISIRQIFEIESKLRASSMLKLPLNSDNLGEIKVDTFDDTDCCEPVETPFPHIITVSKTDIDGIENQLPLITYLAGYCAHSFLKKFRCNSCKGNLTIDKRMDSANFKLISSCDRGGLLYPSLPIINVCVYNYIVVQKLISSPIESDFLNVSSQRKIASSLTIKILSENDLFVFDCEEGHRGKKIMACVISSSTNTLLKNYCKIKNDNIQKVKEEEKKLREEKKKLREGKKKLMDEKKDLKLVEKKSKEEKKLNTVQVKDVRLTIPNKGKCQGNKDTNVNTTLLENNLKVTKRKLNTLTN